MNSQIFLRLFYVFASFVNVNTQKLLTDTEFREDGVENVVGGDFAGDFAEVVEYLANIFADKVGG